ncbi:MAG TPA: hypothetical protein VFC74_08970 [Oscillospiraceae bacterium]|nr:hypothetical protein [Oscillospiraceae bacterium]
MFYYVCCPECNTDLSQHVDEEDPTESIVICSHCKTALQLQHVDQWDEDMGFDVTLFWFEKVAEA